MEVLSPRSLGEALQVKARRPEAVPIQGGTDLMVELNFDRGRPQALLNLAEVPEPVAPASPDEATADQKHYMTAGELAESELVGLWKDRTDITDSLEFARELRRR